MTEWKLVPVEPTEEMIAAAIDRMPDGGSMYANIYAAMLSASPEKGSSGVETGLGGIPGQDQPPLARDAEGSDGLLPCPFCGAAPESTPQNGHTPDRKSDSGFRVFVWCPTCEAQGGEATTPSEAIDAWNTRAQPPTQPPEGDKSRAEHKHLDSIATASMACGVEGETEAQGCPILGSDESKKCDACDCYRARHDFSALPTDQTGRRAEIAELLDWLRVRVARLERLTSLTDQDLANKYTRLIAILALAPSSPVLDGEVVERVRAVVEKRQAGLDKEANDLRYPMELREACRRSPEINIRLTDGVALLSAAGAKS